MSVQLKKRYCECGRELEKYCRLCSECRAINDQISKDYYGNSKAGIIAQHRYSISKKGKAVRKKAYIKWRSENIESEKERKKIWNAENKEHIKEYNRRYYENNSCKHKN